MGKQDWIKRNWIKPYPDQAGQGKTHNGSPLLPFQTEKPGSHENRETEIDNPGWLISD